jgi:hypothetical protein
LGDPGVEFGIILKWCQINSVADVGWLRAGTCGGVLWKQ